MDNISTSNNNMAHCAALLGGLGTYYCANKILKLPFKQFSRKPFFRQFHELPKDTAEFLLRAEEKAFEDTGLAKKGYKFIRRAPDDTPKNILAKLEQKILQKYSPEQWKEMKCNPKNINEQITVKMFLKQRRLVERIDSIEKIRFKPLRNFLLKVFDNTAPIRKGKNACFLYAPATGAKKIILPQNKLPGAGFHEIGHALNNTSKTLRGVQVLRPFILRGTAVLTFFALFTKKSEGNNTPKDFIRNNIGKIIGLSFVPIIAEEALASHRGLKLIKSITKDLNVIKHVKKVQGYGLSSYIAAAFLGVSAMAGVKIKDAIQAKMTKKKEA
jgi:hypothetical protein